jgi:hypothetical protein
VNSPQNDDPHVLDPLPPDAEGGTGPSRADGQTGPTP